MGVEEAETHRRRIQSVTSQDLIDHAGSNAGYEAPADLWKQVPPFSYQPPPAAHAWRQQALTFTALVVWCTAGGVACALAVRRWGKP